MGNAYVTDLTKETFDDMIASSSKPVMVDFWAAWCGSCRAVAPIIDELGEEYAGRLNVCKVNVDDEPKLTERYRVMTIPTVAMFKNGKLLAKSIGVKSKAEFVEMIERNL